MVHSTKNFPNIRRLLLTLSGISGILPCCIQNNPEKNRFLFTDCIPSVQEVVCLIYQFGGEFSVSIPNVHMQFFQFLK